MVSLHFQFYPLMKWSQLTSFSLILFVAAFHLQSSIYDLRKPPAFGSYPQINCLERARERLFEPTLEELGEQLDELAEEIAEQDMTRSQPTSLIAQKTAEISKMILQKNHRRTKSGQLPMTHELPTNAKDIPRPHLGNRTKSVQLPRGFDKPAMINGIPRPSLVTKSKTVYVPSTYDPFQNLGFPKPEPMQFNTAFMQEEDVVLEPTPFIQAEQIPPPPPPPPPPQQPPQQPPSPKNSQVETPPSPIAQLERQGFFKRTTSLTQLFKSRSGTNLAKNPSGASTTDSLPSSSIAASVKGPKLGEMQAATGNHIPAWDHDSPPLFLQEVAHLLSLLSAVAFSTLRNDLEQADSPLITFIPNAPWPHVDPDAYTADVRKDWDTTEHRSITVIRYITGWSRTKKTRTLYNAARPFRVIGGVSDAEIELLQAARGPLAKVALVSMWLQEFVLRESLAGSTGNVAPPILSRLYQFVSDGMLGYHQAHKVAYIPFPFPHAQITSLFVLIVVALMPVLMLSYVTNAPFGFLLNLFTVMSFVGLHEVAREMENPFQNVPNDIPLNNFQAQYNEALMTMFTGYHPDAFWEVVHKKESKPIHQNGVDNRGAKLSQ